MSNDLTPQEKDRRASQAESAKRIERVTETAPASSAGSEYTWIWILVAVIVLVALTAGAIMGFLGGSLIKVTDDYIKLLGAVITEKQGEVVLDPVYADGPAASVGLQTGDELVSIDGKAINNANQARRIIEGHSRGDEVRFVIRRPPGQILEYSVILGIVMVAGDPTPYPVTPIYVTPQITWQNLGEARLGVKYRMLIPEDDFGVSDGAIIVSILQDGGPADQAGLQVGDIILSVENRQLSESYTLEDALGRYAPGERVRMGIWRQGDTFTRTVTLGG